MAYHQKHRGKQTGDGQLFSEKNLPTLQKAVDDLSSLLSKGYPWNASLKLVGDFYKLTKRQRMAIQRAACSDETRQKVRQSEIRQDMVKGQRVLIDGLNLLITLEAILSGGLIFLCRDGCFRDIASIHGSYKKVEETPGAIRIAGLAMREIGIYQSTWLLDKPVSNSGRLRDLLIEFSTENDWYWEVELHNNPDQLLIQQQRTVITSDSVVLEKVPSWFNLAAYIIHHHYPNTQIIDLNYHATN